MVMVPMESSAPLPKEIWLDFDGEATIFPNGYILNPNDVAGVSIYHNGSDIKHAGFAGAPVFVRLGSEALKIKIERSSPFIEADVNFSSHPECNGSTTYCVGGVEYCCNSNKVVGNCIGIYKCP